MVNQWSLNSRVIDLGPNGSTITDSIFFVQNPLNAATHAQLGVSTADTSYAMSWSATMGAFDSSFALQALDSDPGYDARSLADIRITCDQPCSVHFDAMLSYFLPPQDLEVSISLSVFDRTTLQSVYLNGFFDDSFPNGASGTWSFTSPEIALPAGHLLSLQYGAVVHSFSGGSNAIGTASGFANMTVTAVPEPSGLLMLAVAMLLFRRRQCAAL